MSITLPIVRTKRPRDAYKVMTPNGNLASEVVLTARDMVQCLDDFIVYFKAVNGGQRTMARLIPVFYDTDAATATMKWAQDQGCSPHLASGCRLYFKKKMP